MENITNKPNRNDIHPNENANDNFPGYPQYPPREDIYNQLKEEEDIDPEDTTQMKKSPDKSKPNSPNIKDFDDDMSGDDLDVPGSELDDQQEELGSEDEENNTYSIGGDNHENAEENQGDDYSSPRS